MNLAIDTDGIYLSSRVGKSSLVYLFSLSTASSRFVVRVEDVLLSPVRNAWFIYYFTKDNILKGSTGLHSILFSHERLYLVYQKHTDLN